MLKVNALPKKGGKSKADSGNRDFAEARRQHPAIESALNHRGLDRIRTHGKGFVRTVALGVSIGWADC